MPPQALAPGAQPDAGYGACQAEIDVADSFWARSRGPDGTFVTPARWRALLTGTSNIHMLFMRFAIDAVFLDRPAADGTRRVVAVHANLRPWTGIVWYARGADSCLELPAGTAAGRRGRARVTS